jgi:hypothetical protein
MEEWVLMKEKEKFLRKIWGFMLTEVSKVVTPSHNKEHYSHFHFGL